MKTTAGMVAKFFNPEITSLIKSLKDTKKSVDDLGNKMFELTSQFRETYDLRDLTKRITEATTPQVYQDIMMADMHILADISDVSVPKIKIEEQIADLTQIYKMLHLRIVTDEMLHKVKSKTDKISVTDLALAEVTEILESVKSGENSIRAYFFMMKDTQSATNSLFSRFSQMERLKIYVGSSDNRALNAPAPQSAPAQGVDNVTKL